LQKKIKLRPAFGSLFKRFWLTDKDFRFGKAQTSLNKPKPLGEEEFPEDFSHRKSLSANMLFLRCPYLFWQIPKSILVQQEILLKHQTHEVKTSNP